MTEDTRAIVASNLTVALAVLVASEKSEKEAMDNIIKWFRSFLDQELPLKQGNHIFHDKDFQ